MEKLSFREKYLSYYFLFKIVGSLIKVNGIGVIGIGIYSLIKTWYQILTIGIGTQEHIGANIFKSVDIILIGIVFFIFGNSLKSLIRKRYVNTKTDSIADIFDIEGFLHQKHFLWQALATTLLFVFVTQVFKLDSFTWELLVIPISLTLITVSMYFVQKSK
tara:strand:+ start:1445 stop:1927 length:483 start_codon:yes stop_codon:yes gene_type:complete